MLLEGFPYSRKMLKKCKTSIELYDKGSKSFVVEWMLLEGFPYSRKMLKKCKTSIELYDKGSKSFVVE